MTTHAIPELTVLFDAECGLCRKARLWLMRQRTFVPLKFLPLQTQDLATRFPGVEALDLEADLTAIAPDGRFWKGVEAWLIVLWALEDWRERAIELAQPRWRPLARRMVIELSNNRYRISSLIGMADEERLDEIMHDAEPRCDETPIPLTEHQRMQRHAPDTNYQPAPPRARHR